MAVLARSYYAASGRRHGSYEFCDTTHCQWRREAIARSHPAYAAAMATRDQILTYDGKPFAAMYHASCGGKTKAAQDIGLQSNPYPYFPVECEPCRRNAPEWSAQISGPPPRTEAERLDINRNAGQSIVLGNTFLAKPTGDGTVRLVGKGNGHGLGACQQGMSALAAAGMEYRALLSKYLPQTRVGVR
jgi:stage II sporulation protein D